MSPYRLFAWGLLACSLVVSSNASALLFDDDTVAAEVEMPHPPPAAPKWDRLIPFKPDGTSRNTFAIDPDSLTLVDKTGQLYTMVITSPSGVRNVSLEAFRCNKREHKRLAIGRDDGGWTPVARGEWRSITDQPVQTPWVKQLYAAMCSGGVGTVKADVVRERLKQNDRVEF